MADAAQDKSPPKVAKTPSAKKKRLFLKQPQMRRVVYALIPLAVSAVYFFGWRVLSVMVVVYAAGFVTEYLTSRSRQGQMSMALFVTCTLFGLSLPPTIPYSVAIVGIVVGVLFGKEVFGGFGRNFVNPAILARGFVYVCFPLPMTGRFVPVFQGVPGGFAHWSMESVRQVPESLASAASAGADAITQASPMAVYKTYGAHAFSEGSGYWQLLLGNIGGVFTNPNGQAQVLAGGSMGEGCAVLILAAAVYLLWTRTANWKLMLSAPVGIVFANVLFRNVMGYDEPGTGVPPVLFNLLAGTTLFAVVFMVTDPVSATKKPPAQYAYGFVIGFLMVFLRWKGPFVAAATFAILMGNIVGPLLDIGAEAYLDWKKARAEASKVSAGSSATAGKAGG